MTIIFNKCGHDYYVLDTSRENIRKVFSDLSKKVTRERILKGLKTDKVVSCNSSLGNVPNTSTGEYVTSMQEVEEFLFQLFERARDDIFEYHASCAVLRRMELDR